MGGRCGETGLWTAPVLASCHPPVPTVSVSLSTMSSFAHVHVKMEASRVENRVLTNQAWYLHQGLTYHDPVPGVFCKVGFRVVFLP